jgi:hypothetical protein
MRQIVPLMFRNVRLSDYPWVVVRIECRICPRQGRYRLARLAARFGAEVEMRRVLEALAHDCRLMRPGVRPRKYEAQCGVRLPDLELHTPRRHPAEDGLTPTRAQSGHRSGCPSRPCRSRAKAAWAGRPASRVMVTRQTVSKSPPFHSGTAPGSPPSDSSSRGTRRWS